MRGMRVRWGEEPRPVRREGLLGASGDSAGVRVAEEEEAVVVEEAVRELPE